MPELPEVEVVKRSLEKKIQNLIIKKVKINDDKLRYRVNKKEILKLVGMRIKKVQRRSKFLIFFFDQNYLMLAHLGMTGKFFFIDKRKKKYKTSFYYNLDKVKDQKHDRIIFFLEKKQKLIYNDVRKFGFIKIIKLDNLSNNFHLKNLGPEPLKKGYNSEYFKKYTKGKKRSIKNILMDQKFVSGLGNIYVNEILFLSGVKPMRKVKNLKNAEINKIVSFTKKILREAIKYGGSSIKDFSTISGKEGTFQQHFRVYGRKGEKCSNTDCNKSIIKLSISNRGTFYCSSCQK
jgi:formamidopyrimidine-DNA glycosylase|tara:strand:- start:6582 stop:7451 length:870 start_codon:yes stop_codon:yes gene_type:complete